MTSKNYAELGLFLLILLALTPLLGSYMEKVFQGETTLLSPVLEPIERLIYWIMKIKVARDGKSLTADDEQDWVHYALNLLCYSGICLVLAYATFRLQKHLPLNPMQLGPLSPDLALNTAVSFVSNTSWQSYGGETTLSYFSQVFGIALHSFLSAAAGLAVGIAVIRGFARKQSRNLGNFWVDLVRATLYVLIPLCFVSAVFFISQGIPQNFNHYVEATTLEGGKQLIAQGPVASQIPIKIMGAVGGGFFNVNAAHPYENPTQLSNFIQILLLVLIPSALVYTFGKMVRNRKHSWSIWAVMALLLVAGIILVSHVEQAGNPLLGTSGCASSFNMEGKEARFGIFGSSFFAVTTTASSCGAVNSMHDSYTPLGGLIPLVNMLLGEVIFGGLGAGLYGMIVYIILTVFIAGLMVGRTPEYLGKRIEGREVKFALLTIIVTALPALVLPAYAVLSADGLAGRANPGAHGFTEIIYAYASGVANIGSAFMGLSANTPFWNLTLSLAMFMGRFFVIIPILALAGSVAQKRIHPGSEAVFPTHGPSFMFLLIGVLVVVGALTYFPMLTLGPIAEAFQLHS